MRCIIERAHLKIPPFSPNENTSDKGFKDTVIWLSLLDYFKNNGEDEILFVTNDNGFLANTKLLADEFNKHTGKTLEIKPNAYYTELTQPSEKTMDQNDIVVMPDVGSYRERIREIFEQIRLVEYYNHFGDELYEPTFSTYAKFDSVSIEMILMRLPGIVKQNIFNESITAQELFGGDENIISTNVGISLAFIERAIEIHNEVAKRFPDLLQQFYHTVADILNKNYVAPKPIIGNDDELPF